MSSRSIKSEYQKWLWALVVADLLAILLFLSPSKPLGAGLVELSSSRLLPTIVVPVIVLLLVNILPNEIKCMLVYWKPYGWMPGCEAFSKLAQRDARTDVAALAKNVGPFPVAPEEQNSRWYQLYKQVEYEPEISDAHRNFLLYRDMAAISVPFIGLAPICLHFAGASFAAQWLSAALFGVQFFLTAISARWSGIRFVSSVLALHSARNIAGIDPSKPHQKRAKSQQT